MPPAVGPDAIARRVEFQERKRWSNIADTIHKAATELGDKEVPDHEPDPDWAARFFNHVQDVSSEKMRKLWAKILAGEVEKPGGISLRTLDILRNMTQEDAQTFQNICDFVIDEKYIFYPPDHLHASCLFPYSDAIHLESIGLISTTSASHRINYSVGEKDHPPYHQGILEISKKHNDTTELTIPVLFVTQSGQEFYRIVDSNFRMDYLKYFSSFLAEKKFDLAYISIKKEKSTGRKIKYVTPIKHE